MMILCVTTIWPMAYGDWLKELGYASRKIGIQWESLAAA